MSNVRREDGLRELTVLVMNITVKTQRMEEENTIAAASPTQVNSTLRLRIRKTAPHPTPATLHADCKYKGAGLQRKNKN